MNDSSTYLKQSFGIDISKDTFNVNTGLIDSDFSIKSLSSRTFKNTTSGIKQFIIWSQKYQQTNLDTIFVMEATGVYYEELAFALVEASYELSVLLPNKVSSYAASLNVKS